MKVQKVIVDSKQPPAFRSQVKTRFPNVTVEYLGDHQGDLYFDIGKEVRIEVKSSASDFFNSIVDRRLFTQAEGMRKLTPWTFLLYPDFTYDGDDHVIAVWRDGYGAHPKWTRAHVEGALMRVQAHGGICRPAYQGYMQGIQSILEWSNHAEQGSITREVVKLSPFDDTDQQAVNLLTWFEGIGVVQAKHFLEWAGKRPLYEYWDLAITPFKGNDKPRGWTSKTIESNRRQLGYTTPKPVLGEWREELE